MKIADGVNNFSLEIKIGVHEGEGPHPGVSVHWKDAPEFTAEWDGMDQAWTKICDGIHSLLGNLGPIPEKGWNVVFTCEDHDQIVENITQKEYRSSSREVADES